MGYSSRRPHRVPFLSAKNRKQRLQFTQAHQNWTIEDWKNVAWSDESRFLLRHSDGRVRIWRKEPESMDPSCLVCNCSGWWWWCNGVIVWEIYSWHTLNLCHEQLSQFWRQKGVQPGTSKVYLIKWPVSIYILHPLLNENSLLYYWWLYCPPRQW